MSTRIRFEEKDWRHPSVDNLAEAVTAFILQNQYYYSNYLIPFLRITGTPRNYKNMGHRFCDQCQKNLTGDAKQLNTHMRSALKLSIEEFQKFRGTVAEKLVEPLFKERNQEKRCYFGAATWINGRKVIIQHESNSRQTVDAIAWHDLTESGDFMEIKFKPEAFDQITMKYLEELHNQLRQASIEHTIQLLAFDDDYAIQNIIEERSCKIPLEYLRILPAKKYIYYS